MQGTVLSWNNLCNSGSLIVGPLILAAIYSRNKEAIYYVSSGIAFVGSCIMGYVSTWPNAKTIGRNSSCISESTKGKDMQVELKVENVERSTGSQSSETVNIVEDNTLQSVNRDKVIPVGISGKDDATPTLSVCWILHYFIAGGNITTGNGIVCRYILLLELDINSR